MKAKHRVRTGQLYIVRWDDIATRDCWNEDGEHARFLARRFEAESVGFVLRQNRDAILLTSQYAVRSSRAKGQLTRIPRHAILGVQRIKVKKVKT